MKLVYREPRESEKVLTLPFLIRYPEVPAYDKLKTAPEHHDAIAEAFENALRNIDDIRKYVVPYYEYIHERRISDFDPMHGGIELHYYASIDPTQIVGEVLSIDFDNWTADMAKSNPDIEVGNDMGISVRAVHWRYDLVIERVVCFEIAPMEYERPSRFREASEKFDAYRLSRL